MIVLRPAQALVVDQLREAMRNHKSVLLYAPCAFGKTVVLSYIVWKAILKGRRVVFAVHRKELILQTAATFDKFGLTYSYIAAGQPCDPRTQLFIASIPTLRNRLGQFPADFLIIDESHLSMSAGWSRVINHYKDSGAYRLGCTASPIRLDGRGLGANFDYMVRGPSPRQLMESGDLCRYRLFAPPAPDLSGLHRLGGDFRHDEAELLMNKPSITGDAVTMWLKHAAGKRTVAYGVSREHSRAIAAAFRERGVPALHVDGETADDIRNGAMRDLADGKIQVITNCQLFTEGVDISALCGRDVTIECVVNLRPTQSIALWTQMAGRALRKKSEPAIILDHADVARNLGAPDEDRDWQLTGDEPFHKKSAISMRVCGKCWAANPARAIVCMECKMPFPVRSREIEQRDGELHEIDAAALEAERQKRAQRKRDGFERAGAQTLEQLEALCIRKGWHPGRAKHILAGRAAKKLAPTNG